MEVFSFLGFLIVSGVALAWAERKSIVEKLTRLIRHAGFAFVIAFVLLSASISLAAAQGTAEGVVPDTNVARWSFLVGAFLPLAAAAVLKKRWRSEVKGAGVFVLSVIAAGGTSFLAGDVQRADLVSSVLIILVMATITYNVYWKPTGIAPAIEERTG